MTPVHSLPAPPAASISVANAGQTTTALSLAFARPHRVLAGLAVLFHSCHLPSTLPGSPMFPWPSILTCNYTASLPHAHLFPPGPLPPLHPNTNLCCNTVPSSFHPYSASCPLSLLALAYFLLTYPDWCYVTSLLHIIQSGAKVGFCGDRCLQSCKNLYSALLHLSVVARDFDTLCQHNRVSGPFSQHPMPHFRCSPLAASTNLPNSVSLIICHDLWGCLSMTGSQTPKLPLSTTPSSTL